MIVNGYSEQIDTRRMIADVDVNMASPDIQHNKSIAKFANHVVRYTDKT